MPHPHGGSGNTFQTKQTFESAYAKIGSSGKSFQSTRDKKINAVQSMAADGITQTITFYSENGRVGNVCKACWGFRKNCSGTRIGQCSEALDELV